MADTRRLSVPTNPARALRDLSRERAAPLVPPEPDDEENTTILQSDKPTDRQTDNLTHQLTNLETDQQTNSQTTKQTDKPPDKLSNKPRNRPTNRQVDSPTDRPAATVPKPRGETTSRPDAGRSPDPAPDEPIRRADGRTLRVRQNTADRTMVTSLRLNVSTVELLDEYCWTHRQKKQDVVQAALDLYFATDAGEG